ncbi:MAG: dTDP-glucose 4,6-dehydratase [Nitrospira sp.]|nr:dTDP-glucose 4,6-dehydratase [Nitrospira sp.]
MKLLITGGCGFIGSNFIRHIVEKYPDYTIVNLDALTYAGNPENLRDIENSPRYRFTHGRIEDSDTVRKLMKEADCVVNFAAESHVDRSILDAQPFLMTNIMGTHVLLEVAKESGIKRFIHISTDEVYGTLPPQSASGGDESEKFSEESPLKPNSPYAASKASGDLLVRAYYETYRLPVIIVRPSNNYGPYQFPEKFIPLMITNLLQGEPIPIYGKGENVRDWIYVEDNCKAIDIILHKGTIGEAYNVGGDGEMKNIALARNVLSMMGKDVSSIKFVQDRPGHDYRYALDNSKIETKLGWNPSVKIEEGLQNTIQWYKENEWWWQPLKERLSAESKGFWEK